MGPSPPRPPPSSENTAVRRRRGEWRREGNVRPEANFRTDPPTRPRKLKADRAAVEPDLVIDRQP